jgi:cell shape-determining protein MreD
MRYIVALLLFLISVYFHLLLNFYGNGWQYVQPFLISLLLIYFNTAENWLAYVFALVAGILLDSISAVFGFNTIVFLSIIFILKTLQLTTFTSKNIFTILLLTFFSFLLYWLFVLLANSLFYLSVYNINVGLIGSILKGMSINIFVLIFLHVCHYNFWVKKNEKQSF